MRRRWRRCGSCSWWWAGTRDRSPRPGSAGQRAGWGRALQRANARVRAVAQGQPVSRRNRSRRPAAYRASGDVQQPVAQRLRFGSGQLGGPGLVVFGGSGSTRAGRRRSMTTRCRTACWGTDPGRCPCRCGWVLDALRPRPDAAAVTRRDPPGRLVTHAGATRRRLVYSNMCSIC